MKLWNTIKRSAPAKLWRLLNPHKRIKNLPGGYAGSYDNSQLDLDARILIMAALARDQRQAQQLMIEYGAETALDVLKAVENAKRRRWWHRLMDWLRRIEGTSEHDPLASIMDKAQPSNRRIKPTYRSEKDNRND